MRTSLLWSIGKLQFSSLLLGVVEGCFLGAAWFGGVFSVALACPGLPEAHWLLAIILDAETTQNLHSIGFASVRRSK